MYSRQEALPSWKNWKDHLASVAVFCLLTSLMIGTTAIAATFWGNSLKVRLSVLYTFLPPLITYLLWFASLFLRERTGLCRIQRKQYAVIRALAVVLIAGVLVDGLSSYARRLSIGIDRRYRTYYEWLSRNQLGKIRPNLALPTPGVYPACSTYRLVNSAVTTDRFGFRREVPHPHDELAPDKTVNVLWVGGSVVFGMTSEEGDITAVDMLEEKLASMRVDGKPVRVYNAGIPGMHVEGIVGTLMTRFKSTNPDIVVFYEGINSQPEESVNVGIPMTLIYNSLVLDMYHGHGRSKELAARMRGYDPNGYGNSLDTLTERIRELGAYPIYVTFSTAVTEHDPFYKRCYWDFMAPDTYWLGVLVRENNDQLVRRASKNAVTVADSRPLLHGKGKYFVDHCHLTQEGMDILATLVMNEIIKHVRDTNRN